MADRMPVAVRVLLAVVVVLFAMATAISIGATMSAIRP